MSLETSGIKVPDHFTVHFFKESLQNGLKVSNIEIIKIVLTIASCDGENYCSKIYRAFVNYKIENHNYDISLILKVMSDALKSSNFQRLFNNEIKMYKEIIPEMEKILETALTPKFFFSLDAPYYTMVFEDLKNSGYELEDRTVGFNEENSKIVLLQLAKYHAASMVLGKKNPSLVEYFNKSIFHCNPEFNAPDDSLRFEIKQKLITVNLSYIANLIKKWQNYESIALKIEKISDNFIEKCLKIVQHKGISVLNHGDLWVNNIMIQNNSKGPLRDVKFIDLPIAYWGSLGMDLQYFLNTSVQIEILKSKRYDLLRTYYDQLTKTLEKLQFDEIPNWDDFKNDILQTELYGFFVMEAMLPIITLSPDISKENSFESFVDATKTKRNQESAFSTERMIETLKFQLNRFDELGIFDREC